MRQGRAERQRNSNDPCRRWKHFLGHALEHLRRSLAGGSRCCQACRARCTVGVAGIDGDYAYFAPSGAQVFLVYDKRRCRYTIRGEGRGRAGWRVGNNQGKVGAAALLEAGLDGAELKTLGKEELGCV